MWMRHLIFSIIHRPTEVAKRERERGTHKERHRERDVVHTRERELNADSIDVMRINEWNGIDFKLASSLHRFSKKATKKRSEEEGKRWEANEQKNYTTNSHYVRKLHLTDILSDGGNVSIPSLVGFFFITFRPKINRIMR